MKVTVCIGSYCHLKGSRTVAERLRERIAADMKRRERIMAMNAIEDEELEKLNY